MPEGLQNTIMEMETIIQKTFNRIKTPLMSDKEMPLCDLGKMIDILKDTSEAMKNITKVKKYYSECYNCGRVKYLA